MLFKKNKNIYKYARNLHVYLSILKSTFIIFKVNIYQIERNVQITA